MSVNYDPTILFLFLLHSSAGLQDFSFSLTENSKKDTLVGSFKSLSCTTFTVNGLDDCCAVNDMGWLQTTGPIDRETKSRYKGSLDCEINQPPFFQTHNVDITIGDENDNSPVFTVAQQSVTLQEQTQVPSQPFPLIGAVDSDSKDNSVSRYELLNHADIFQLQTGLWAAGGLPLSLILIKVLDYENDERKYTLEIKAYDVDDKSATMTVTVVITDINDNKPVFDHPSYSGSVSEGASTQTVVLEVQASDGDGSAPNNEIKYSIIGGGADLPFAIQANGDVIVTRSLDRETKASYTFQVKVSDAATPPLSNTANVVIVVTDVNDNAPDIFSPTDREIVNLNENLPPDSLVTGVQISDLDEGENSRVSVVLKGSLSSRFKYVSLQGGVGQILTTQPLDREEMSSYLLIIRASDSGTSDSGTSSLYSEVQFTVLVTDENDNNPLVGNCDQPISVAENFIGEIRTVEASDSDETGPNSNLTYSITDTANFGVDAVSGVISLKSPLDYETSTSSHVTVSVSDSGTPSLSTDCQYSILVTDVNDNPPSLQSLDPVTLSENVPIGTKVATLSASDPDKMDTDQLRFSLNPPTSFFSVNSVNGEISVTAPLDRETSDIHVLTCVVSDTGLLHSDSTQLHIQISDISDTPPVFLNTPYSLDLSDSTQIGKAVFKVDASDPDIGDTLSFRLDSPSSFFSLGEATGELTLIKSLDTASASFTISIVVNDGKFDTKINVAVKVYQDDGVAPVVTMKSGNKLSEAVPVGSAAGQCSGSSTGPVAYSFAWDAGSSDYKGIFVIDFITGAITTSGQLDFESYESYKLTCIVTNIHGHATQAAITVSVSGVNEFEPEFERGVFFFSATDDVETEKVVGQVLATDKDRGNDGILQYHLVTPISGWDINSGTGEIVQLKSETSTPLPEEKEGVVEEEEEEEEEGDQSFTSPNTRNKRSTRSYHEVELMVEVKDSPADRSSQKSARANVTISVQPAAVVADNSQTILIGGIAGGVVLFLIILIVMVILVHRRKKASSGSKELVYVNPTTVTDKDGREITADKGYHSGGDNNNNNHLYTNDIQLSDMNRYPHHTNESGLSGTYSSNELGPQFAKPPPHYDDAAGNGYNMTPPNHFLNVRDKLVPHKLSVSTVLSDMRNDVHHLSAVPRRLNGGSQITGSLTHSGSYESVHVFGSEGGGEGEAAIDTPALFKKLSDLQDTDVMGDPNKTGHILGDQDSAFSSLGSSNGEVTTPYHSEYLQNWKPAFESVGSVCEGMLRNKQFAYQSSHTPSSRHTSSDNLSSSNHNALSSPAGSPANRNTELSGLSSNQRAIPPSLASGDNILSSHLSAGASVHSCGSTTHL